MPRPLYEENIHTKLRGAERGIDTLFRRGPEWWVVFGFDVPWENGWADPADPLEPGAVRWSVNGDLEFKGDMDGSAATSEIACHLPDTHWPTKTRNYTVPMNVGGLRYGMNMSISHVDGAVSITPLLTFV
jgi:hypothetical protein